MKIAVAAWEGHVSPVFDTARQVVLFEVAGQEVESGGETPLSDEEPTRRIQRLRDLGVGMLICGAVSRPMAAMIQMAGIRLIPFIAGPVDDVLKAYVEGTLTTPAYQMPGCCGARRRFRGGRGCKRQLGTEKPIRSTIMPGGNGTGPTGQGSGTGRGRGPCGGGQRKGPSAGAGKRQGRGRGGKGRGSGRGQAGGR